VIEETENSKSEVSRLLDQQVTNDKQRDQRNQAVRAVMASSKLPPIVNRAIEAGYGSEIVCVAPPGATLSPNSKIDGALVGKIPMLFDRRKGWWHGYPWTRHIHTEEEFECCAVNGGGFGFRGDKLVGLDCDVDNEEQVKSIIKILHGLGWRGAIRCRSGSPRILMVLSCKSNFVPAYRYISWREPNGAEHTIECLGQGKFYVVHGIHPKTKTENRWVKDVDPFVFGIQNLTQIDGRMFDKFFAVLRETINTEEWGTFIRRGGRTGSNGQRKPIDDPSRWAPSPQDVLEFFKVWPNTPENVPTHHDFVAATAAIKTAFGPDREDYYPEFLQWAMEYPGNDEDYVRGRWDSIA
jgi:hypothetical protein